MKDLFFLMGNFVLFLAILAVPTILLRLIFAYASIWRCLLTVCICVIVFYAIFELSNRLMFLMKITVSSSQNLLINFFIVMPLSVLVSAGIIKKFMHVKIGNAIVLSVVVLICVLLTATLAVAVISWFNL